jgi:catechol 2,3-dioxygenase-like lactoylglutathione lyase family enzyme
MTFGICPANSIEMNAEASLRRIDHLVMPARDLDAQAAFYARLGFTVGARNIHPWGTENRIVQFDGAFLELITLGKTAVPPPHAPRHFSFGAHVAERLAREGDGLSMLVLDSADAQADAIWFQQAGIGDDEPFRFGRKAQRPDGSETEVAFTLAFATPSAMPDVSFFTCQQHFPENFWNPANQVHENTVAGLSRVVAVHDNPAAMLGFLKAFAGGAPVAEKNLGLSLKTRSGIISVWTPDGARAVLGDDPALFIGRRGHCAAVLFQVRNLGAAELCLRKNNVPHRREKGRIIVPSGAAFGVLLAFEEGL